MQNDIQPGLLVLHGNRPEALLETLIQWITRHPLRPLEEEVFLVQSNGVAEWLKMELAAQSGVCAAAQVELPGRFLWRAYRQVLGRDAVPAQSALDRVALTWRLMHLLPAVVVRPGYEPLARFLADGDPARRLQLAERLADLYDQYQVYRGDWLAAWEAGHDSLPRFGADHPESAPALPGDQRWQAALWRELLLPLDARQREAVRSKLHARFVSALQLAEGPVVPVARRVVLFGMTHVPMQTLESLAALAAHCQVILAIPNPSRYHWADIIDGRELLQFERRRQPLRADRDLAALPLEQMHAHGHPLLAAWGRQSRDFVRQLDAFDDVVATQRKFNGLKLDLFDEGEASSLLQQVQARIRDLVPAGEVPPTPVPASDRSMVFHVAHSPQREVEILHDQLLALLAAPADGGALQPRDIVVMVPDIAKFAPAVRSVFGQYPRHDARFIPFEIVDLQERGNNPLLVALEWLLRIGQQRCGVSEIRDLLDVPAVAQRFGLDAAELPRLNQWMTGAGIRWGLDATQRADLQLEACGAQNTWLFGLRRILLGYASGAAGGAFEGIEPYEEVGGLEAAIAGSLADLLAAVSMWRQEACAECTPSQWVDRLRALLAAFFASTTERERLTLAAADDALKKWLDACDTAGFDDRVPLNVAREAWLPGIDTPDLQRRFRSGGVTFCTLLPMRAVPFEVVCLLGMNDGDFPRSSPRLDFDLMGLPGVRRPGDRARRDDDRQLMLEALLSARRVLYVSWTGRSVRNNSEQPPSVLVSQLRDYLASEWQGDVLGARTTEHPLQPFSRKYFEVDGELFTHAREWRSAHAPEAQAESELPPVAVNEDRAVPLTVATLVSFLRNPVKHFFQRRLSVVFDGEDEVLADEEPFALDGLAEYGLVDQVVGALGASADAANLEVQVQAQVARFQRSGQLPMADLGQRKAQELIDATIPMLKAWRAVLSRFPDAADKTPLRLERQGVVVDDWLDGLRSAAFDPGSRAWTQLQASRLCTKDKKPELRPDKLLEAWVRALVAGVSGDAVQGVMVGRDATVTIRPMERAQAQDALDDLLLGWREGMTRPLPVACLTAFASFDDKKKPRTVYEGNGDFVFAESEEACLARVFPDFDALNESGEFEAWAKQLYEPVLKWVAGHVSFELHASEVAVDALEAA